MSRAAPLFGDGQLGDAGGPLGGQGQPQPARDPYPLGAVKGCVPGARALGHTLTAERAGHRGAHPVTGRGPVSGQQPEPAWDSPGYRMIGLERTASTIPEEDEPIASTRIGH